ERDVWVLWPISTFEIDANNGKRSLSGVTFVHRLHADPREECRQLMELRALPAIGWMIVAIGTLDLDAQEDSRDFGRDFRRLAELGSDESGGAVLANVAGRRDEGRGELVPRCVLIELLGEILG